MIGQGFCREMRRGEERDVETLLCAAFGGHDEVKLVDRLRREGAMAGEMVMPGPEGAIGFYALSWFRRPAGWLCLAPVAIAPAHQGRGHGRRMIGQLCAWAVATRQTVVVLGQMEFYERAGFSKARAARLTSPYPLSHTALAGLGDDTPDVVLDYPAAFTALV